MRTWICCAERKIPQMESVSETNHRAEAIQCPSGTMLQENEAVIIAVMATHYT